MHTKCFPIYPSVLRTVASTSDRTVICDCAIVAPLFLSQKNFLSQVRNKNFADTSLYHWINLCIISLRVLTTITLAHTQQNTSQWEDVRFLFVSCPTVSGERNADVILFPMLMFQLIFLLSRLFPPFSQRMNDLHKIFSSFGVIRDVYIPRDFYTRQPRGFAYIEFDRQSDAEYAVRQSGRIQLYGRFLEIEFAQGDRKSKVVFKRQAKRKDFSKN